MTISVEDAWLAATQQEARDKAELQPATETAAAAQERANRKPYRGWDLWRTITERLAHKRDRRTAERLRYELRDSERAIESRFVAAADKIVGTIAGQIPEMEALHVKLRSTKSQRSSVFEIKKYFQEIESSCESSIDGILSYRYDLNNASAYVGRRTSENIVAIERNIVSLEGAISNFEKQFPSADDPELQPIKIREIVEEVQHSPVAQFFGLDLPMHPGVEHLRPQLLALRATMHEAAAIAARLEVERAILERKVEILAEEKRALIKTTLEKEADLQPTCSEILQYVINMSRMDLTV